MRAALMRGPEPRRRVHALIHILLLDIDVTLDVNDAHVTVDVRGDAAYVREAQAVIAAADDGKYSGRIDMRDGLRHLIEGLLDIAGDDKNIAGVTQIQLFVDVHPAVEPVSVIESRNA